ncbi:MAG TPA: 4-vinyl reductase [Candidatus Thermoplasmatota archaeon]|nr:4-vinyl reductase [Candidatus Thermoplasmatota archaeon]
MAFRGEELIFLLVALGCLAALVIAFATWLAAKATKPAARKPPRKTFEHGRRLGRAAKPASTEDALRALRSTPVGDITSVAPVDGRVDIVVSRKRTQPCTQAAGYLAGLFETAWAHEVHVAHPQCGGEGAGACHYVVTRAPIVSGARAAEASTPGSGGAPRRSPRARAGRG